MVKPEDVWSGAVNGTSMPEPNLPDPGQPEKKSSDDPIWNKAGAVTMAVCISSIVLTICLVVLKLVGVL